MQGQMIRPNFPVPAFKTSHQKRKAKQSRQRPLPKQASTTRKEAKLSQLNSLSSPGKRPEHPSVQYLQVLSSSVVLRALIAETPVRSSRPLPTKGKLLPFRRSKVAYVCETDPPRSSFPMHSKSSLLADDPVIFIGGPSFPALGPPHHASNPVAGPSL